METKPSFYTSELWLTVILQVIFALNTLQIWTYMPERYSALAQSIIAAAYLIARGLAKNGAPADPALAANYRLIPKRSDGVTRR